MYSFFLGKKRIFVLLIFLATVLGAEGYYFHFHTTPKVMYQTPQEADVYVRFMMEAYDTIDTNFWIKPGGFAQFSSLELPQLFQLAVQKEGSTATLSAVTRTGTAALLADALATATSTRAKQSFALKTLETVLYALQPVGRSSLLSKQEEIAFRQEVANVNPSNDLYGNLGLEKGATLAEVAQAYEEKKTEIENATSSEIKAQLPNVEYAHQVLTNSDQKVLYDTSLVEPSVFPHVFGATLYLSFNKIAPTTLQEFGRAVYNASTTVGLESMILDMRGNIGGALDFTPAFLGLFIGNNQYAFDLYHQGDTNVERTTLSTFPELSRYKEIAILTDHMTQSTAEVTAAALKRLRIARVVGTTTRGWGSVENTYSLKTTIGPTTSYALLLVNSLTLRDDQQPIEQNGVVPDVDIGTTNWQSQLNSYFASASLVRTVSSRITQPPLR
ncbi:hypothetical protein EXS57_03310 [Candidatus Kaiserbacteria bacterium]|nr:hypothetical protein [Candidatus Kaiserbacteria bacterium]